MAEKTTIFQKLVIFKRGEQEDVPDAPPLSYLPHPNASLLYKRGTTRHLSEHLQLLPIQPLYPPHPTYSHLSRGNCFPSTSEIKENAHATITTQQIFFQHTQSQESTVRRTRRGQWNQPTSPGLSQLLLCLNTSDTRASTRDEVSHLPSSLQGSTTLQRGSQVPLPWGMPGHHSTAAASKLRLRET